MEVGAQRRELHKNVYRRLNIGVVTFATAALIAEVQSCHTSDVHSASLSSQSLLLCFSLCSPAWFECQISTGAAY